MMDAAVLHTLLNARFDGQAPALGLLFIVCGPSCSGKTTLCDQLTVGLNPQIERVLTSTTRPMRPGEVDGVHYRFLSPEAFEAHRCAGHFYEYAQVHGRHYYGTLKSDLVPRLKEGKDLLLNIDVQGAAAYREQAATDPFLRSRLVSFFMMPASLDVLRQRFMRRGDAPHEVAQRLASAQEEMRHWPHFHYVLVTQGPKDDLAAFLSCYVAEKLKVRPAL
jgi:guanylate kinase